MKIAIDSGPFNSGDKMRGIGFHTKELVKSLEKLQSESFKLDVVDFSRADLSKYDVAHFQSFNPYRTSLPFFKSAKKIVLTIHDLIYLIYPKAYLPGIRGKLNFYIQKFNLRNIDAVITISETSKKDIVRFLNISPEKIFVTYLAPQTFFKKPGKLLLKQELPKRYVLYVGDVNYNKNIPNLIRACRTINTPLVIVGKQALEIDEIVTDMKSLKGPRDFFRFLMGKPHPELIHYQEVLGMLDKNVIRLGFVEDLDTVFKNAAVYCQPSFYEGFGLPLLESFQRSVPVVASRTQALVEVGGDACLYVDPKDPLDMAKGLKKVIDNKKLAHDLVKKGKIRLRDFSWEKTAKETLDVYKQVNHET